MMMTTSNVPISSVAVVDNLLRAATNECLHLSSLSVDPSCPQKPLVVKPQAPATVQQTPVKPSSLKQKSSSSSLQRQRRNVRFPKLYEHQPVEESDCDSPMSTNSRQEPQEPCLRFYHPGPDIDLLIANRKDLWYQQDELKHMKRKAMVVSKEAQRYGLGSILTNTYGNHNHHPHNLNNNNININNSSHSDDPAANTMNSDTQQALNTWSRNGSSRRGLERWINDEYAAKRSDIRKRTIQSVLRAQAKMRESIAPGVQQPDAHYSAKVLSRLSEAFSVDSRHFARSMGIADELALREQNQQQQQQQTQAQVQGQAMDDSTTSPNKIKQGSSSSHGGQPDMLLGGIGGNGSGSGHGSRSRRGSTGASGMARFYGGRRGSGGAGYAARKPARRSLGLGVTTVGGSVVGGGAQDLRHYC